MNKRPTRSDDYEVRRQHLKNLSEDELKKRFWELAEKTVNPLIDLAYKNTSPAIERSIVLRMGFSSLEAKDLVEKTLKHNLITKGAGHVIYRLSQLEKISIREAGMKLINDQGWTLVKESFEVK
ncbi:MAG: ornithine aminomutase subunit alpha [Candidatus Izemoplasmatales bacterium]|uniref:Ornithine aminomutase n=1 Tax=Hujiaoplasma nucleasis TaxID=2725268 RepID=A0A7L6N274_9MOLU|nr:ornithine aminomutase subunit alpha [Hujiaoplasma nucleasis]QLY39328.1 ornithine aminomutase [Hujiaoplasma nucleasis]